MGNAIGSKLGISLGMLAAACIGLPASVSAQGMFSVTTSGPGHTQQDQQNQPGRAGQIVPKPRPAPVFSQPMLSATVHQMNPNVSVGTPNPMPRQSTWPSPWNYAYPNSDGSLGYNPGNPLPYYSGYGYGGYTNGCGASNVYPSVYSTYASLPQYINDPGAIVDGNNGGQDPQYDGSQDQSPDQPPTVTYNQYNYNTNNYYLQNAAPAAAKTDDSAKPAGDQSSVKPDDAGSTYQAAFGDIEKAWTDGNIDLIKDHLRDSNTKVNVDLKGKYAYSIDSDDFAQITKDAFANLNTVSFEFTRLRKEKNGDVTAFGVHNYLAVTQASAAAKTASDDPNATVPFSTSQPTTDKDTASTTPSTAGSVGSVISKKVYVSFTLRQGDNQWYIVGVDSSTAPLVADQD